MLTRFRRILSPLSGEAAGRGLQTLNSLDAYAQWATTYPPHAHNVLMEAEQIAMTSLFPSMTGKVVLDLACGTGRYGLLAQESGAKTVLGLDNSPAMLLASPLSNRALATTEAVPLSDKSVDVILCGLALGHLPRLAPSIGEIARVLKPGGVALVSDFHPFIFLNGARRTFTAPDGKTYAVEHYAHLYSAYQSAASDSGLHIEAVLEPCRDAAPIVIVYKFIKNT
ncbi:MAG: class I SAM-dependent methyltransferase [Chloroflexota bacterium]